MTYVTIYRSPILTRYEEFRQGKGPLSGHTARTQMHLASCPGSWNVGWGQGMGAPFGAGFECSWEAKRTLLSIAFGESYIQSQTERRSNSTSRKARAFVTSAACTVGSSGVSDKEPKKSVARHTNGKPQEVLAHPLGHCFATHRLETASDLRTIAMLLADRDLEATTVYGHLSTHVGDTSGSRGRRPSRRYTTFWEKVESL